MLSRFLPAINVFPPPHQRPINVFSPPHQHPINVFPPPLLPSPRPCLFMQNQHKSRVPLFHHLKASRLINLMSSTRQKGGKQRAELLKYIKTLVRLRLRLPFPLSISCHPRKKAASRAKSASMALTRVLTLRLFLMQQRILLCPLQHHQQIMYSPSLRWLLPGKLHMPNMWLSYRVCVSNSTCSTVY
jgi:hypothetical protein